MPAVFWSKVAKYSCGSVYAHVRFNLVLLISSIYLSLSKYEFSSVYTDLGLLNISLCVRIAQGFFFPLPQLPVSSDQRWGDIIAIYLLWKPKVLEPHS